MEYINLETKGVKGGKTKVQQVGYLIACLRHRLDMIVIDDYISDGKNYIPREQQLIEVIENGKVLFSGTKHELFEKLKP
jgi:hypothetical protein